MARHQPRDIPEPAEAPLGPPAKVHVSGDLPVEARHAEVIARWGSPDEPFGRKYLSMAMGAMADLAEGGMILPAQYVSKLQDSLGRLPDKDDILKFFEAGLGRKDGKLEIRIYIDPAHEKPLLDAAEFNGFMKPDGSGPDPERYYQQIVNWSWDNGAFHQELPGTRRILMLPGNYEEMRELCGGDFDTGTDFCRLMKAKHKVDEVDVFELLQPKGR